MVAVGDGISLVNSLPSGGMLLSFGAQLRYDDLLRNSLSFNCGKRMVINYDRNECW